MPGNFIAERNADDAQMDFLREIIEATPDLVTFVNKPLAWDGEAAEFVEFFKGSFNLSLAIRNRVTDEQVLIRFPIPGKVYGPWRAQKIKNEIMVLAYL